MQPQEGKSDKATRSQALALKMHIAGLEIERAFARLDLELRRYHPDQPRVPAGNPDGGQWTDAQGGLGGADRRARAQNRSHHFEGEPIDAPLILAGALDKVPKDMIVQEYLLQNCQAGIYSVFPGEFLDKKIVDVLDGAKNGNAAARTCIKLLSRGRFKK